MLDDNNPNLEVTLENDSSTEFDLLVSDYFQAWFRFHPVHAVDAGFKPYAADLTPTGDDDRGVLVVLNEKLLSSLEELDRGYLDEDRMLDYDILMGHALLELKQLNEGDWRSQDPIRFLPIHAIQQLLVKPMANFPDALMRRLESIPDFLREAKSHLSTMPEQVPQLWIELAVRQAVEGVEFLRSLHTHPKVLCAYSCRGTIDRPLEEAIYHLRGYIEFLSEELSQVASGDVSLGEESIDFLLQHRFFMELNADQLYVFACSLFDEVYDELRTAAHDLYGEKDVDAAAQKIRQRFSCERGMCKISREQLQAAYQFLKQKKLFTLPKKQQLQLLEAHESLLSMVTWERYCEPSLSDVNQCGYLFIGLDSVGQPPWQHDQLSLTHTCVTSVWPGRHLQAVLNNQSKIGNRLTRTVNASETLKAGWSLYAEQLVLEQGFFEHPEDRFVVLSNRLWHVFLLLMSLELHTRGKTLEQIVANAPAVLSLQDPRARSELLRHVYNPEYSLAAITGWWLISTSRNLIYGEASVEDLRDFHDRLLSAGPIPVPLIIERQFGEAAWRRVKNRAYDEFALAKDRMR